MRIILQSGEINKDKIYTCCGAIPCYTAGTRFAYEEFIIMLNQAADDRIEFVRHLDISDLQIKN